MTFCLATSGEAAPHRPCWMPDEVQPKADLETSAPAHESFPKPTHEPSPERQVLWYPCQMASDLLLLQQHSHVPPTFQIEKLSQHLDQGSLRTWQDRVHHKIGDFAEDQLGVGQFEPCLCEVQSGPQVRQVSNRRISAAPFGGNRCLQAFSDRLLALVPAH
eukprot:CAMPEP_0206622836 /NCGR_PEP_ID=MMETSP0325_2-20121206/63042_1 /ASSEMBLY_ACC=CAM_ASM_000347 /TAXON_ID=2866 /ORGANISM="Crypthecodinium cohnii, Strain Seligo" /LENGTH=160 /DNA_ID=CAMNT_0054146235 /DNA_START=70 /DNA_END=553 /DNA_ORIENTATION=-